MDVSFLGILSFVERDLEIKLENGTYTLEDLCYSLQVYEEGRGGGGGSGYDIKHSL
jgi:hypothetical protein